MLRAAAVLLLPGSVLAHPGHGAPEMHWHADVLAWAPLGAAVVAGIVFLLRRKSRR